MDALSASFHSKPNHVGLNNAKVISKNDFQNIDLTNMILNQICILIMLSILSGHFFLLKQTVQYENCVESILKYCRISIYIFDVYIHV